MPDYNINISRGIFNDVYLPYLVQSRSMLNVSEIFVEIFFGGSSSGKSHFLAHRLVMDLLSGGHNYLCVRKLGKSVIKSVFNEVTKAIDDLKVRDLFKIVPSQSLITCENGYQVLFTGLDDPEKVKSITPSKGVVTDIWYEEATEGAQDDIRQLKKRLRGIVTGHDIVKRIVLSFNPIYKTHWIFREFFTSWKDEQTEFNSDSVSILKVTHLDNKFLTSQDHNALESEPNEYWYQVYTLGNWGALGDAILTNWEATDLKPYTSKFTNLRNGLDFGYSDDPAAYVRMHYDRAKKEIYIFDGFEEKRLTNPDLAARLLPYVNEEPVFADCAEPKSIDELRALGIYATPVKKGPGSLLHGIQWLQQHKIYVDISLQHVINELTVWSWKKNKHGESLPIPEDKFNHSLDAVRYGLEIDFGGFFAGLL